MTRLRVSHTADLEPAVLEAAHDLLRDVFEGELTDHDWEHSLGGMHALAWDAAGCRGAARPGRRRHGTVRTPEEDDCIFVLPGTAPLDLDGSLTCDWRDGDGW